MIKVCLFFSFGFLFSSTYDRFSPVQTNYLALYVLRRAATEMRGDGDVEEIKCGGGAEMVRERETEMMREMRGGGDI